MLPKRAVSEAIGWGGNFGIPERLRVLMLTRFARIYGIDVSEAEKPLGAYADFDEFFTRKLRPGLRPIADDPASVVSPADGTVVECGLVTEGKLIQAKGTLFDLGTLLGNDEAAARLNGGAYVITYLSPKDYHRVHAPVGGGVIGWHHIPGTLFMVGARSVRVEPGLFIRNERFVTLIEMDGGGLCAVVMVAAIGVGHVTAAYDAEVATHGRQFLRAAVRNRHYDRARPISRGEELGVFHLGSTTIAVFEPGRVQLAAAQPGEAMKMGAAIGRILPAQPAGQG
jgi:phosphatidylserine decarboxylase